MCLYLSVSKAPTYDEPRLPVWVSCLRSPTVVLSATRDPSSSNRLVLVRMLRMALLLVALVSLSSALSSRGSTSTAGVVALSG